MNKDQSPQVNTLSEEQVKAIEEIAEKYYPKAKVNWGCGSMSSNEVHRRNLIYFMKELITTPDLLSKLNLQVKSEWIKIEEGCKMPEQKRQNAAIMVLVQVAIPVSTEYYPDQYVFSSLYHQGKFYVMETWSEDGIESNTYNAIAWMPLPNKPTN